jgi:GPH family glycoside/pentoside/hexuronide:cation symporter/oligogalacturonide transporter
MKKIEKFAFASADMFGGGGQAIISVLYMIFLTDVIGISPVFAGTVILLSKVWDAVNDPLMGIITDNTRSRWGRRRPYLVFGGFSIVLAVGVLWFPVLGLSQAGKSAYVLFAYLFYNTISGIIEVPYSSLSTEITTDYQERNGVNILRLVFSTCATAVFTLGASEILRMYTRGLFSVWTFYLIIVAGSALFFGLPLCLAGFLAKERTPIPQEKTKFSLGAFFLPFKSGPFRSLIAMYLCQAITMDIFSNAIMYYSRYVVRGVNSTVFLGIFIGIQLLAFPLIQRLVKKIDKNRIYYTGLPLAIAAAAGVSLYPRAFPAVGVYGLTALLAVGFAGAQLMCWIIFPDAVDSFELKTGLRNTGSFSGIMTFIRKVSAALVIQVFGIVLSLCGYIKPVDGVPVAEQPGGVVLGIRLTLLIGVPLLLATGWLTARKYPLSRRKCGLINKFLRSGEPLSPEESVELEALRKAL